MIKVDTACMSAQAQKMQDIANQLNDISGRVASANRTLRWNTSIDTKIRASLNSSSNTITGLDGKASRLSTTLYTAVSKYESAEEKAKSGGNAKDITEVGTHASMSATSVKNAWDVFVSEFKENFGWGEILSGAGYIGTIYGFIQDIKNFTTWTDVAKYGVKAYNFAKSVVKTYGNYAKIGRAVGTKQAAAWWFKNAVGLKKVGRTSTAKGVFTRFKNNLKNKTSPHNFKAQFKDYIDDFTFKKGVGKAVSAWGQVAVTGVLNWFGNKEEQAQSGGTMSDGRVVAETVMETAIDTVVTHAAGIVVGAAVAAVAGPVAVPGVVIAAGSALVVGAANAGVKALTGKTATEWVSDVVLDGATAMGKAVTSKVKAVGKWFSKLSLVA